MSFKRPKWPIRPNKRLDIKCCLVFEKVLVTSLFFYNGFFEVSNASSPRSYSLRKHNCKYFKTMKIEHEDFIKPL